MNWMNGIPIVGHAKSLLHYCQGQNHLAAEAFKRSTHNTGTLCFGVIGDSLIGHPGIFIGDISGGIASDAVTRTLSLQCYGYMMYAKRVWSLNLKFEDWEGLASLAIKDWLLGLAAFIMRNCKGIKINRDGFTIFSE